MNHLGLFEGIGGFSLAARWMGWDTVAWCLSKSEHTKKYSPHNNKYTKGRKNATHKFI